MEKQYQREEQLIQREIKLKELKIEIKKELEVLQNQYTVN